MSSLANAILKLLIIVLLIDPSNTILGAKTALFLLFLTVWIITKMQTGLKVSLTVLAIMAILISMPFISLAFSLIYNESMDFGVAASYIRAFMFVILIIPVLDLNFNLYGFLIKSSIAIAIITLAIFAVYTVFASYENLVYDFFVVKHDTAKIAVRNFFGVEFTMIFYHSAPLLIFPFTYFLHQLFYSNLRLKAIILCGVYGFCLIISGTRANILCLFMIITIYVLVYIYMKISKTSAVALLTVIAIISFQFLTNNQVDKGGASDKIKSGHLASYIGHFSEHPKYLLTGQGIGTSFYTSGFGKEVYMTELTYFELVRVFGVPLVVMFLGILFIPFLKILRPVGLSFNDFQFYLPYLGYLFIAGTNPLLISSTGFLVIVMGMEKFFKNAE